MAYLVDDGTSFFVGGSGMLARISPDGTTAIANGYPLTSCPGLSAITWSGTTGWYVACGAMAGSSVAQIFDATGAMVGGAVPLELETAQALMADGPDLLAFEVVSGSPDRVVFVRIDATGKWVASTTVGVVGEYDPRLFVAAACSGSDVFVGWSFSNTTELALVAP